MIECEALMINRGLAHMENSIGSRTLSLGMLECTGEKSEKNWDK